MSEQGSGFRTVQQVYSNVKTRTYSHHKTHCVYCEPGHTHTVWDVLFFLSPSSPHGYSAAAPMFAMSHFLCNMEQVQHNYVIVIRESENIIISSRN